MVLVVEYYAHQEKYYGSRKSLVRKLNTVIKKDIDYRNHELKYTPTEKREMKYRSKMENLFS